VNTHHYDLVVCIRCHAHLDFVLDTAASVSYNTDPKRTRVTFAVDGGCTSFAAQLQKVVDPSLVYVSPTHWGWGAGLWSLLTDSILTFDSRFSYSHFQSIDYDTLYIAPGADQKVLDLITDESIGLIGCYNKDDPGWRQKYHLHQASFEKTFGIVPKTYGPGERMRGSYMTLTRSLIETMRARGMWKPPYSVARQYTVMPDDHLATLFTRMCEMEIVDTSSFAYCMWNADGDLCGREKNGIAVVHPTKMSARNKGRDCDVRIRNYFRKLRGETEMLK